MNFIYKRFLTTELQKWRESGLVDAETTQHIANHYSLDLQVVPERKSSLLELMAYFFLALAFITLIGANWDEIPRGIRLVLVIFVTLGVQLAGYYFHQKEKKSVATNLFLLGNFCYGAAIALIAQIYHLGEHMPNGILLWAIGSMALSVVVGRSILVAQSLCFAFIWFCMELFQFEMIYYSFGIFLLLGIWSLLKENSNLLVLSLFFGIFLFITTGTSDLFSYEAEFHHEFFFFQEEIIYVFLAYCLLATVSIPLWEYFQRRKTGFYLHDTGLFFATIFLLGLLFVEDFGRNFSENIFSFYAHYTGILYLIFLLSAMGICFYSKRFLEMIGIALLLCIPPLLVWLPYPKIFFSIVNILLGAYFVKQNRITAGLGIIFFVAVVRYVDLIGDYIGASLLFVLFAVILLIINFKRKKKNENK